MSRNPLSGGVDLNAVIVEVERLLRQIVSKQLMLTTRLEVGLGRIDADPKEVGRAFVNLMVGAHDGAPAGQELLMSTANIDLDLAAASEFNVSPGSYVQVDLILSQGQLSQPKGLDMVRQLGGATLVRHTPGAGSRVAIVFRRSASIT